MIAALPTNAKQVVCNSLYRSRRRTPGALIKLESKLFPLPKKQNPQHTLRASCKSGRQDSNLRPLRPERNALPGCATSRNR
jgi:hypothetical protein